MQSTPGIDILLDILGERSFTSFQDLLGEHNEQTGRRPASRHA